MTDYQDDEQTFELDFSKATVKEDLFLCEIKQAKLHTKVNEQGETTHSISMKLEIVEGPFKGTQGSTFLGLDMSKGMNARRVKNFMESMLGESLTDNETLKFETNAAGDKEVVGAVGEYIGAYMATNKDGFVNVTLKGFTPASVFDAKSDDEEPF